MALDRREAGAAGHEDDRLVAVLAQEEAAVRAFEAQDGFFLHAVEHVVGEQAAGNVADVQLQEFVVVRRVGEREAAPLAVLEQDVDVLPGEELQAFVGRQLQMQYHHVVGDFFHFLHAAGHGFDRDVARSAHFLALDHHVGERLGGAEQGHSGVFFVFGKSTLLVTTVIHPAFQDFALAAAAGAVAAAIGQGESFAQPGFQQGFVLLGLILVVAGFDGDLK